MRWIAIASESCRWPCQPNLSWQRDARKGTSVDDFQIGALMQPEFQRVAIVNRGEAAMRFIHAAREFGQEHNVPLTTIALFCDPDRHAMFVREADEAVSLGAAQIIDPNTHQSKSSYVDYDRLKQALATARDR